jgi:DNA ligase (NAD+)
MQSLIKQINENLYSVLETITKNNLVKVIKYAANKYYNTGKPVMEDEIYDLLVEYLEKIDPKNDLLKTQNMSIFNEVTTNEKNVETLPFYMGSMDKVKPKDGKLDKFLKKFKNKFVVSDKLDGTSGMLVFDNNGDFKLYTRGRDGINGTNITVIKKYIPSLNNNKINKLKNIAIRGEFLPSRNTYKKYKDKYSNSRAMVNGIINSKTIKKNLLKDIDFVAYELVSPRYKASEQFKLLKKYGFKVVFNKNIKKLDEDIASKMLLDRRENSEYDIDGIIFSHDNLYESNKSGNPKHSFAWKQIDEVKEVIVEKVEWNISKDGYIKPRIHIKPTKISGVLIKHVTGHNAKNIINNKIGPGAVVKLVRSGEVIPYIIDVIKKAKKLQYPKYSYKWNATEVDFILDDNMGDEAERCILIKNIVYFFKKMNIKNADENIVIKMIDVGLDTIPKILSAKPDDFLEVDGFKEKMANKIYNNIQNSIKSVKIVDLMNASNKFGHGLGKRKLELIIKEYPNIVTKKIKKKDLIEDLMEIDGYSTKTAELFADNLPKFKKFLKSVSMIKISKKEDKVKKIKDFKDKTIVFTGFRNDLWKEIIKFNGGNVTGSVTKNTDIIVTNDKNGTGSKLQKAKSLNKKIMSISEFSKKFKLEMNNKKVTVI